MDFLNNDYRFCDDNGQRFVGVSTRSTGQFGDPEYVLCAERRPDIANALEVAERAVILIPNPWFADIASLRRYPERRLDVGSGRHAVRR